MALNARSAMMKGFLQGGDCSLPQKSACDDFCRLRGYEHRDNPGGARAAPTIFSTFDCVSKRENQACFQRKVACDLTKGT